MKWSTSPKWWLVLALGLTAGGLLSLIAFMLWVWPPGALLVVAVALFLAAGLVDVPRPPRSPRAPR